MAYDLPQRSWLQDVGRLNDLRTRRRIANIDSRRLDWIGELVDLLADEIQACGTGNTKDAQEFEFLFLFLLVVVIVVIAVIAAS